MKFIFFSLFAMLAWKSEGASPTYTINIPGLEVKTQSLSCREITFGFDGTLHASMVTLSNRALSDNRVLITGENDTTWQVRLPAGSCPQIQELKKKDSFSAEVRTRVTILTVGKGEIYPPGLHVRENSSLKLLGTSVPLTLSYDSGSVAGGMQAEVTEE